jgi:pyridoxal 5'-phosphate synthase pdxT subunit
MRVGILALQGSFAEHAAMVRRLGHEAVLIRAPAGLDGVGGLIIPGGESTTIGRLLLLSGLLDAVRTAVSRGLPVYGTCAGLIVLARDIGGLDQPLLGVMDISVQRNAFGRQLESFEEDLDIPCLGSRPFHGIFIRAPRILRTAPGVTVLARRPDGAIVAAEQGPLLASSFHPELTDDTRMHGHFLRRISLTSGTRDKIFPM